MLKDLHFPAKSASTAKSMRKKSWRTSARGLLATMMVASLATVQSAQACTSFLLGTSDGGSVYGRTMEFAFDLKAEAIVIPRGYGLGTTGADGKPGMEWKSRYGIVGLNALGITGVLDGMNEKGLAGGILYFPGFVGYADAAKADPAKSLAPWDFLTWALSNYATVAEVKAALDGLSIIDVEEPTLQATPPVHYTLHDASGASIVIEPVDGVLKVYDNPLGVMTNSPSFDWHMTNLRNYLKLSPTNAAPLTVDGLTISSLGQGSGLLGMPGDPTPPSRFIRALGYTLSVEKQPSGMESVRLAEHLLNNFDIPTGWIRDDSEGGKPALEYTQWSSIADLKNLQFYVKTYEDQVLRGIDLMSFDLDGKALMTAPLKPELAAPAIVFPKS